MPVYKRKIKLFDPSFQIEVSNKNSTIYDLNSPLKSSTQIKQNLNVIKQEFV